jgi:hypothetical protein
MSGVHRRSVRATRGLIQVLVARHNPRVTVKCPRRITSGTRRRPGTGPFTARNAAGRSGSDSPSLTRGSTGRGSGDATCSATRVTAGQSPRGNSAAWSHWSYGTASYRPVIIGPLGL